MRTQKFKIFAHRGLANDNSLSGFKKALDLGLSIETDVRWSKDGRVIILHDVEVNHAGGKILATEIDQQTIQQLNIPMFDDVLELVHQYKKDGHKLAIHIKEPGNRQLIYSVCQKLYDQNLTASAFIFDIYPNDLPGLKSEFPEINIGVSVAEKKFAPYFYALGKALQCKEVDIIWADEWNENLYNLDFFKQIKLSGKKMYAISPELHINENHPLARSGYQSLWADLIRWEIDGICTDHTLELNKLIA